MGAGEKIGQSDAVFRCVQPESIPNGSLWVGVDEQGLHAALAERRRDVHRRRRLSHAAFLADDREHLRHQESASVAGRSARRSDCNVSFACWIQRSLSGDAGGRARKACRCPIASSFSFRLRRRNASP